MKHLYTILFSISLVAFTAFILLDTFLLSTSYKVVEEKKEPIINESTEIIREKNYYKDNNIEIKLTSTRKYNTDIYIADIKIKDINYLKTAFAKNTFGKNVTDYTSTIAKNHEAILAINGDFYGVQEKGFVLKNGIIYRETIKKNQEDVVIKKDGTFDFINESETNLKNIEAKELLSFGPILINNGEIKVNKNSTVQKELKSNPRTAIAMYEPLHYLFMVSDGRTKESEGLSLYEMAEVLKELNVDKAYNLDGGGSSSLYFNGEIINKPMNKGKLGERKVSDIVYIGY